jgi:serine/threonine protein kinase
VPFNELVFHQVVGRGSFKCVYRGSWHNTNVAIVRMHKGGLVTEARLMQQLSTHPNLVQFYRWAWQLSVMRKGGGYLADAVLYLRKGG